MTEPQKQTTSTVTPLIEKGEHPLAADPLLGQANKRTSAQGAQPNNAPTLSMGDAVAHTTNPPSSRPRLGRLGIITALILLGFYALEFMRQPIVSPTFRPTLAISADLQSTAPHFSKQPIANGQQASVHGATLTPSQSGWLAAWYGGTREGAKDVQLFTTRTLPTNTGISTQGWTVPQAILSRTQLDEQLGRYVKKLGNPMLYTAEDGKIWLFFVSVSVGGWAGSAVNVMVSSDNGLTFSPPRRLTTSPFFNVSTLVRNRPISLSNGGMVIPIYHEFMGKFCELLWLDAQGNITDKQRLSWGRHTLQPAIVAKDDKTAAVFMRISAPKTHIEVAATNDGGKTFSTPQAINLPNANAAIDASLLPNKDWLLVYNHDPIGRDKLAFATASSPEGPWHKRVVIDQHQPETDYRRFAYPALVAANGHYELLYTVERSFIQSVSFNSQWLDQYPLQNTPQLNQ